MKTIVKTFLVLVCAFVFESLASEVQIESILSAHENGESIVELSKTELYGIMALPPREAVQRLFAEAESRSGSEYAKCVIFSAALIEMMHLSKTDHQALTAITEWVGNVKEGQLEDKLLKAFSPFFVGADDQISILQTLSDELDNSEGSPHFELYGSVLVFGLSGATAAELLNLKTIEALVRSGDFESADPLLDDAEGKQWPAECANFLASIRLLRNLQEADTPLFKTQ